jgi:hypothetical protein
MAIAVGNKGNDGKNIFAIKIPITMTRQSEITATIPN